MHYSVYKRLKAYLEADPLGICKLAGITPTWQQAEVLKVFKPGVKIAIKSGHGVGKSLLLALLLFKWLIIKPFTGNPYLANSKDQLRDVCWKRINEVYNQFPKWFRDFFVVTRNRVYVAGHAESWFVAGRTYQENKAEALQGYHNCLFLIDEASLVPDEVFDVAMAALTEKDSTLLMAGNPTRKTGFFIDSFKDPGFIRFTFSAEESPLVSDAFLKNMRRRYGVDSDEYRIRVLGEPPQMDDEGERLIADELIRKAIEADPEEYYPEADDPIIMGVDVAYRGADRSAAVTRQGRVLLDVRITPPGVGDTMKVVQFVIKAFEELKPDRIFVDINGYGAGVKDRLRELGYPAVGVMVTESPIFDPDIYYQLRDELYFRMREWFIEGCRIPKSKDLIEDLRNIYVDKAKNSEKLKIMSKFKLRSKRIRSPDVADALALTFYPVGRHLKKYSPQRTVRYRRQSLLVGY